MVDDGMNGPQAPMCLLRDSSVILTCEVDGFPRPDVIFRNGSVPIVPGQPGFERVTSISMDQVCCLRIAVDCCFVRELALQCP